MPNYRDIYQTEAERYDLLVSREDYQGNILKTLMQIRPFTQTKIVEFGAGTGRLTRMLAPHCHQFVACDISPHMLQRAKKHLAYDQQENGWLVAGENGALPLASNWADIAIEGWSFAHSVSWHPHDWQIKIGKMLAEMRRVLTTNGTIIMLETLGTGRETPLPPTLHLDRFYRWLEAAHGFTPTWIRTDYLFQSVAEAEQLTRFFFGDNMADSVRENGLQILPECTGIWWLNC